MKKFFLFVVACFCMLSYLHAAEKPVEEPAKMTPLVGRNCVINQIDKSLIDLFGDVSALGNIVDTNTNNYTSFSSLAGIDAAYHQIVSIMDAQRTFKGGTEAGFVMQSTSEGTNLLTVDVLEMFIVETYKDGVKQESSVNSTTQSGLLDLNLITVSSDGKTKVSIKTSDNKDFDEIRLAIAGVNVDALSNLRIYYAYVGENPIHPITKTEYYKQASVHSAAITGIGDSWTTAIWNWPNQKEKLVGANSENDGVGFGTLSSLLTEPRVTINAGQVIPANTEIGFMIESGSVLAINLLQNTVLTTYDSNNNEVESKTILSVLGLSAVGGGRTLVSMITTKPCQQIKIKFGGLNIDVGGTKIFYAYTRSTELYVEPECDLKLSADISVCEQSAIQLNGAEGITWSIEEQPTGANATVSSSGLLQNMTVSGPYVVKAQKGDCVDYITVTKSPSSQISSECNRPIVGSNIAPFSPAGGGCLLCLSPDLDNGANNVVDEDLTNYIEYTKGLDLLSNTSIYGVQDIKGNIYDASTTAPRRVGFVMQATDQFLTADVLKFFVIKTYLGDNVQESSPIDENDAVGANLISGMSNQMRFSFVATKPFDRVTIWTAGVLSLNLSKFRIYYAFEEPANSTCMSQYSSGACLSLLSAQNGASLNYERTGFNGVANVGASMTNLANILNGDMNTYSYVNKTVGIAANTTISIKANQVFEHGFQAGFVVEEQTWVGNVDLLRSLKIKTYLNGVATGDETTNPEVLSLDLIGSFGKSLVAITPTQPFDEIQLDMSGLLDALVELKVYGAFVQPDTDGDGIPDCMDKNPCGEELMPFTDGTFCVGDQVEVRLTGGKNNVTYILWDGTNSHPFDDGVVSYTAETPGKFNCTIREDGVDVYTNLLITIHPLETQWTGKVSRNWNEWDNWTTGTPYGCTNVIIPSLEDLIKTNGVVNYPVLEDGMSYVCNNIHFAPGAEVVRQDLLEYNQAWVELKVIPQRQYLLSIPLKETYAGDIFINLDTTGLKPYESRTPFTSLLGNVRRANPAVTSRIWNARWAPTAIETPLTSGFSMKADNGIFADTTSFIFRFGKEDLEYQKYSTDGAFLEGNVIVPRDSSIVCKLKIDKANVSYIDTLNVSSNYIFIAGNPFTSHLSVTKLIDKLNENGNIVQPFVKVYDGNIENPSIVYNKPLVTLNATDENALVAPMEGFFLEAISTGTRQLIVPFTPDMMIHGDYTTVASPQTRSASSQGNSNSSKLNLSSLKAYTQNGKGIIESSEKVQKLQVFTASGKLILEKQNVAAPVHVPLSDGVNIIKVQTENETKTFKLIK